MFPADIRDARPEFQHGTKRWTDSQMDGWLDGEANDIPSCTAPQSCGYKSDDLTFNFTVGRFRRMSRRSADVLVAELLRLGHKGRGKQRALLIGQNQTFRVQYNRSRRRGIRAPWLQLMRARVQARCGDTFYHFLICELWPGTWQPLGLQHLGESRLTFWGLLESAADQRGPKSATGRGKWKWRRGKRRLYSVWGQCSRETLVSLLWCKVLFRRCRNTLMRAFQ